MTIKAYTPLRDSSDAAEDALYADLNRVLACLRAGPMTSMEIAYRLHLNSTQVQVILNALANQHIIHAPRCTTSAYDHPLPLWEMNGGNSE